MGGGGGGGGGGGKRRLEGEGEGASENIQGTMKTQSRTSGDEASKARKQPQAPK